MDGGNVSGKLSGDGECVVPICGMAVMMDASGLFGDVGEQRVEAAASGLWEAMARPFAIRQFSP
jgi:hypothetical protein